MDETQLRSLYDHLQIENLLKKYCRGIDRCDKDLLKSVYWPDAFEDHGMFVGKAWEFADYIIPLLSGMKVTMHQISNTLIELDGDKAVAETCVQAYHLADNPDGSQTDLIVGGRYLDRFERRAGEWRIANRVFVLDWNQNLPATCVWDSGLMATLKTRGRHDRLDPSYQYFKS